MRFAHFSTVDQVGGAALATLRLHRLLNTAGHESRLVVGQQTLSDPSIIQADRPWWSNRWHQLLRTIPGWRAPKTKFTFNLDWERGFDLRRTIQQLPMPVDIIGLHWINRFLTTRKIRWLYDRLQVPILWHLWDQEPVTGGCNYSFGCEGYLRSCGNCPLLAKPHEWDISRQVWLNKRNQLQSLPITFIAANHWGRDKVNNSSLFRQHRVEVIPIPLDEQLFCPADRLAARTELGLPLEGQVLLFGASYLDEERKGASHLIQALRLLHQRRLETGHPAEHLQIAIIGKQGEAIAKQLPWPCTMLGHQTSEAALARCYQAADLFVCPSLEDAGPMMIPESLLCGTPVVCYRMGNAPDLIQSGVNGYMAELANTADLARGIEQILAHPQPQQLSENARRIALAQHAPANFIQRYTTLASELQQTMHE